MKETDLAKKIIEYFDSEHNEVFQEVHCQGVIDIIVRQGNIITAIECKLNLGFEVIAQAYRNKPYAHYSYIAIPKWSGGFQARVCCDYGIGVLWLNGEKVIEVVKPRLNRRIVKPRLHEYQKLSVAGSQTNRMTAFKWFVKDVHKQLKNAGEQGLSFQQLFDLSYRHYPKLTNFKSNLYRYTKAGVIKNVRIEKGTCYYTTGKQPRARCK